MRKLLALGLFLLALSSPAWSQVTLSSESTDLRLLPDFDPSFTYQVSGLTLNLWKADSIAQDQALRTAYAASGQLEKNLSGALNAVIVSQASFETYKNSVQAELISDKIVIGSLILISLGIMALK